jgi:OTU domain-containing protein 6
VWNAQLERERQEEIAAINGACKVLHSEVFEIQPDGHCMFSAVADQLGLLGLLPAEQVSS